MLAYKLFKRRRDGTLGPLFINSSMVVPVGKWVWAGDHPKKGFAHRPGWHCCATPTAPHLTEQPKSGEDRVWALIEIRYYTEHRRPAHQGASWYVAKRMKVIDIMENRHESVRH